MIAIGVLDGQLRFADATQTTDALRLTDNSGRSLSKLRMKLFQLLDTSGKEQVAGIRNIPDRQGRIDSRRLEQCRCFFIIQY